MGRARFAAAILVAVLAAAADRAAGTAILPPDSGVDAAAPSAATETLSERDRRLYRRAFEESDSAHWAAAFRLAQKAENPLPAKVLRWRYMTRVGNRAEFDDVSRFIEENLAWPFQRFLRRTAEKALARDGTPKATLDWLGRFPPVTSAGQVALAIALADTGQEARATALAHDIWIGSDLKRADERKLLRRFGKTFSADDHWARLDRLLWDERFLEARRMMRRVDPGHRALATARMRLARQRAGVDSAVARVPQSLQRDPGLLYERARWRRRKGFIHSAFEILDNPPDDLVRPMQWWVEREFVARRLILEGRHAEAFRLVSDHRMWPGSAEFAAAEFLSGWLALRFLQRPAEALLRFERLYASVQYPISRARAAYWAGRAATALDDREAARKWYADAAQFDATFYGQLAARHVAPAPGSDPDSAGPPSAAERAAFNRNELVRATSLMAQIGRPRIVALFVRRLSRIDQSPHWLDLTAELARRLDRTDLSVRVARYAHLQGVELDEAAYPVVDLPDTDVEKAMMLAIARQESNFAVNAISAAGARGMMQLMPYTAKAAARGLRLRYSKARLTRDGDYNVRLAMAHFADLRERYDSNDLLAVAAYNAGRRAIDRWMQSIGDPRKGGVDPIDWIEMIPFSETRNYIHRVLENVVVYRRKLGETTPPSWIEAETLRARKEAGVQSASDAPSPPAAPAGKAVQSAEEPPPVDDTPF